MFSNKSLNSYLYKKNRNVQFPLFICHFIFRVQVRIQLNSSFICQLSLSLVKFQAMNFRLIISYIKRNRNHSATVQNFAQAEAWKVHVPMNDTV
jgi:hypothetical protein